MQVGDPRGAYTDAEVLRVLTGGAGPRILSVRYDLLDKNNTYLRPVTNITGGSVNYNFLADIKRTAKFTISGPSDIDFLSNRIKPWVGFRMPDGGLVEWPQGVFLLSTPTRTLGDGGDLSRDVDAYDQLLVLRDAKTANRYSVNVATKYTDAIKTLAALDGIMANVVPSHLILLSTMEWEPGTSHLEILNDLLAAVNYESAFFDENGRLICRPYQSAADRGSEFAYVTDSSSVIAGDIDQTTDLFDVPNQWVLVKSEADQPVLRAFYENTDPLSPTSTVSRGRTITDFRTEQDAPDLTTLGALVRRLAFEASQVYEVIEFDTLTMPIHTNADVYDLTISDLGVSDKYSETGWSLKLAAGATMSHKARKVVTV